MCVWVSRYMSVVKFAMVRNINTNCNLLSIDLPSLIPML